MSTQDQINILADETFQDRVRQVLLESLEQILITPKNVATSVFDYTTNPETEDNVHLHNYAVRVFRNVESAGRIAARLTLAILDPATSDQADITDAEIRTTLNGQRDLLTAVVRDLDGKPEDLTRGPEPSAAVV